MGIPGVDGWVTEVVIEGLRKERGLDLCLKSNVEGYSYFYSAYQLT